MDQRAVILLIVAAVILVGSVAMWSIPAAGIVAALTVGVAGVCQVEMGDRR